LQVRHQEDTFGGKENHKIEKNICISRRTSQICFFIWVFF